MLQLLHLQLLKLQLLLLLLLDEHLLLLVSSRLFVRCHGGRGCGQSAGLEQVRGSRDDGHWEQRRGNWPTASKAKAQPDPSSGREQLRTRQVSSGRSQRQGHMQRRLKLWLQMLRRMRSRRMSCVGRQEQLRLLWLQQLRLIR